MLPKAGQVRRAMSILSRKDAFTLVELLVVVAIIAVLMAILLPALNAGREKARQGKCISNLRQQSVALEMWHGNSGYFPPGMLCGAGNWQDEDGFWHSGTWPEALAMEGACTPEMLENDWQWQLCNHSQPEDFSKTIEGFGAFACPSDNPHPHRMNEERMREEFENGESPYRYSYGFSRAINLIEHVDRFRRPDWLPYDLDKDSSAQILTGDGLYGYLYDFRAGYLENPNAAWNQPYGASNTVGYFHTRYTTADFLCRDGSAKSVYYGIEGNGVDTTRIFFLKRGGPLDAIDYPLF